jgi:hypothetical protein
MEVERRILASETEATMLGEGQWHSVRVEGLGWGGSALRDRCVVNTSGTGSVR